MEMSLEELIGSNGIGQNHSAIPFEPNSPLIPKQSFASTVLNKFIHPTPREFFGLGNAKILEIYTKLHPTVNKAVLQECLNYQTKYLNWAGSDLFHVKTNVGQTKMILVETNTGLTGFKAMPEKGGLDPYMGYREIMQNFFNVVTNSAATAGDLGGLAVIYDEVDLERFASGVVLSQIAQEKVWVVEYSFDDANPPVKWVHGVMHVRDAEGTWHPIRGCYNTLRVKPWNRIPFNSKTIVMNNIIACLCGGRNKGMAAHAYNLFNAEYKGTGLQIEFPETQRNVKKEEIPTIIQKMGGKGVVKVPYCNRGTGIYTILNSKDLTHFMESNHDNEKYIVQYLVTPYAWRKDISGDSNNNVEVKGQSESQSHYFHMGTLQEDGKSYVNDLRMVISSGEKGFTPTAIYSRRAKKPIESGLDLDLDPSASSWDTLGTNINKLVGSPLEHDSIRRLICDEEQFPKMNLDLINLIDGYIQSVLAVIAIDNLCKKCVTENGEFNFELFQNLNPDKTLLSEIIK